MTTRRKKRKSRSGRCLQLITARAGSLLVRAEARPAAGLPVVKAGQNFSPPSLSYLFRIS